MYLHMYLLPICVKFLYVLSLKTSEVISLLCLNIANDHFSAASLTGNSYSGLRHNIHFLQ